MRLYRTSAGEWAGTQADARALAGKAWEEVEVPTDKPSLLAWLNVNAGPAAVEGRRAEAELDRMKEREVVKAAEAATSRYGAAPSTHPARDMSGTAVLSRIPGGRSVDEIAEAVACASGYVLKRYAGAVAVAFERLGT